jgi:enoyl-CoA hydratase
MADLLLEVSDGVEVLTLNRPAVRNAMDSALRLLLVETLATADRDPDVSVVVITGTDPAFSAGVDLKERLERGALGVAERVNPGQAVRAMRKPVICAVNGACATGALEIALSASFIIASERARFADTHARVGLLPRWGMSALLPRAVGIRKAREMTATGNFVDATEAVRIGLVNEVVPHGELMPRARGLAADIVSCDPAAVQRTLALYDEGEGRSLAAALGLEAEAAALWEPDPSTVATRFSSTIRRGSAG